MSARASTLHLKQQVQMFLEWLWGQTKYPVNMINALRSFDLVDATLQALQDLLKGLLHPPTHPTQYQSQPFGRKSTIVHKGRTAGAAPHHH